MITLTLRTIEEDGSLEIGIKTNCEESTDPGAFEAMYKILGFLQEQGIVQSDNSMRIH